MEKTISLTAQEWFNNAWERAKNPVMSNNSAGYATYDRDCEGGCFIGVSDKGDILKNISGAVTQNHILSKLKVTDLSAIDSIGFLVGLQRIHDAQKPSSWATHLRLFAETYNLTVPE